MYCVLDSFIKYLNTSSVSFTQYTYHNFNRLRTGGGRGGVLLGWEGCGRGGGRGRGIARLGGLWTGWREERGIARLRGL